MVGYLVGFNFTLEVAFLELEDYLAHLSLVLLFVVVDVFEEK